MIEKVLGLVGIFKELPEAVGYSVCGPVAFSFPKEIRDILGQSTSKEIDTVKKVYIHVDNFTNMDKFDVSILYRGKFHYTPGVYFERRDIQPVYENLLEEKSLLIKKLPAKESVYIEVFLDKEESFFIDDVMIQGKRITKWMNKIANMYRYPWHTLTMIGLFCFSLAILAGVSWVANKTELSKNNYRIVNEAMSSWGGCTPQIFKYSIETENILSRKFQQQAKYHRIIYQLNKVHSFKELKLKDTIILCEESPKK
jgi:hypothetical protein